MNTRYARYCLFLVLCAPLATMAGPDLYVAASGDDGNDGLSWETAKATLEGAKAIAVSPSTINVGSGVFSANDNIIWTDHGGVNVVGSGPTETIFRVANSFILGLNGCEARTTFADFKVEIAGDGNDWGRTAFGWWTDSENPDQHLCNVALSNLWLNGEYDGDQLNGIPGTSSKANGSAVFFGGWGTETALQGEAVVSHCLIEGFGRAVAYDDYGGGALSHTVRVDRCTIVNCASPDSGDCDLVRLRGSGGNRTVLVRDSVIAYGNADPSSNWGWAIYNLESTNNRVVCGNNLVWHIGPASPHDLYYRPEEHIEGEETDAHYEPNFKTIGGEPYVLADEVDRGWRTTEPELPQYYVSTDGDDGNDGLTWETAKLTLEAARNIAVSPSTINVGPGTFSGEGNQDLYWGTSGGIGVVGAGPTATVFQTSNTGFIRDLNGCSNRTLFANFKVEVSGDGNDWARSAFQFWSTAAEEDRHWCNATISNVWMTGEYDGDQLNGIPGTRSKRNGTAVFFGGWGTETALQGEAVVSHCLIEGFGRAVAYDGYEGSSLSHTVRVERCTIVNCASPDGAAADMIRLRASASNRWMNVRECVIAYNNVDPFSQTGYAIYNNDSLGNHVTCSNNLIWHIGPVSPHENYYRPADRIEGEENDVHYAPVFHTNNGLPYALAADEGVLRGWLAMADNDGDGLADEDDPDDDNDGMTDEFEIRYGLNPFVDDAGGHADGDGMSNWEEYIAGTDPTNSVSCFRILAISGDGTIIRWTSAEGRFYSVQATTNLPATVFSNVAGAVDLPATPDVNAFTNPPAGNGEPCFYRVQVRWP
ncbi:hypothetical protein [Pontiella sp.]|uniref:hypothetical protein n=1 Tax=Pontiella sp. TaxID=2837462 RepID=UPI00356A9C44